jgi:hypothetical protein
MNGGVGLALQWLATRLQYKYVVHGDFAMRDLRERGIAQFVKRRKRGPFKCPDFFAVDSQDKVHLIECKENQGGPKHIDRQFVRGRQQKQNVRFVNEALVEQRFADWCCNCECGQYLAQHAQDRGSGSRSRVLFL